MALIAEDPPSPRPRGQRSGFPVAACGTVMSAQSAAVACRLGQAAGTASRPAPTTMKS
jgi:hypothetical protein